MSTPEWLTGGIEKNPLVAASLCLFLSEFANLELMLVRMLAFTLNRIRWSASSRSATWSSTACTKWSESPRHCATIFKQREALVFCR